LAPLSKYNEIKKILENIQFSRIFLLKPNKLIGKDLFGGIS